MAHKLMVLSLCSLFLNGMVLAGGYSRVSPDSGHHVGRLTPSYDDVVVVESPIIDLDVTQSPTRPDSYVGAHQQVGGQHGIVGAAPVTYPGRYQGPLADPVVLPDGTLADTPEVVAARRAHLIALEQARSLDSADEDDGSYDPRKYEYDEYAEPSHAGVVGPTRHYNGVKAVQATLNNPYQRPLPQQQPFNGQYYDPIVQYPVNGPVRTNYLLNGQNIGTQGPLGPQYTQVFGLRTNVNTHHLESLAARGQLTRQYIEQLIAQYPKNREYLEKLYLTNIEDNHYTESYAFPGLRERPLHDLAKKLIKTSPQNNGQFASHTNALNTDDEKYSNVVAVESPITNAVVPNTVNEQVEVYSATSSDQANQSSGSQEAHKEYSNAVPVQSTIDSPVEPNYTNRQALFQPTNLIIMGKNPIDIRVDQQPAVNNYVDNTHYVPAAVNGRFVTAGPYGGPLALTSVHETGFLSYTPEVAAARAAHFTAHQIARERHAQWVSHYHNVQ